jgi:hypothetical protein
MNHSERVADIARVRTAEITHTMRPDRRAVHSTTKPSIAAILGLQRMAGNRAVAGLLEGPHVSVPLQLQRDVGWKDASKQGKGWNVGQQEVGQIHRVPLQDLKQGLQPGTQAGTTKQWIPGKGKKKGHWVDVPTMVPELSSESAEGKAIVLVPAALNPKDKIEVVIFLHGFTESAATRPFAGWRQLNPAAKGSGRVETWRQGDKTDVAPVRDVALDQAEQQLQESGYTQTIIVLPQGGLHSEFGAKGDKNFDSGAYSTEVVTRLFNEQIWKGAAKAPEIGRVSMAGHSGAGATLASMARESVNRQAGKEPGASSPLSGDLVLFDAINRGETKAFTDWALMRLNLDLAALQTRKTNGEKTEYLKAAPKLRGYYSTKPDLGYGNRYRELERAINSWFSDHGKELGSFADALHRNFTVVPVPVHHEELMRGVAGGQAREGAGNILDALRALHGDWKTIDAVNAARRKTAEVAKAVKLAKTGGTGAAARATVARIIKTGTGKTVEAYFADLDPDATFLGRKIRPSSAGEPPGVHREFAARLKAAEATLVNTHAGETTAAAGARLQVKDIAGMRVPKAATGKKRGASMHCFGLAVDVDHDDNPFVGNEDKPEKAGPEGGPSLQIMQHATLLLAGDPHDAMRRPPPVKGEPQTDSEEDRNARAARAVEQWRLLNADSEMVRQYLSMTPEQLDAALRDRMAVLKAWKDAQTTQPATSGKAKKKKKKAPSPPPWAPNVTEAKWWHATHENDIKQSRRGDFGYGANPAKHGIMTLHEEIVQALVAAGLSWGGTYSGEKDIMHFDLRSGSIGQAAGAPVV